MSAFRLVGPGDADAVVALVESAFRGDSARRGWTHEADLLAGQRIDAAMVAPMLDDPRQQIVLAEEAGALVGCVNVAQRPMGVGYLGMLTVSPDRQAAGLGSLLLREAERIAVEVFASTRLEMTVIKQRADLIAYYERRGWRHSGREEPFPYGDSRYGRPRREDLVFVVLQKELGAQSGSRSGGGAEAVSSSSG